MNTKLHKLPQKTQFACESTQVETDVTTGITTGGATVTTLLQLLQEALQNCETGVRPETVAPVEQRPVINGQNEP